MTDTSMDFIFIDNKEGWKKFTWVGRCTLYPIMILITWFFILYLFILQPVDKHLLQKTWAILRNTLKPIFFKEGLKKDNSPLQCNE
jgi:hypothetical protein